MNELKLLKEQEVLGKDFKVYGDVENPLFKASDVAEWIDYSWKDSRQVNRDVSKMLSLVDEDEKTKCALSLGGENYSHGGLRENTEIWFLTENGLYEVLMLSRKPIAKEFKKQVKVILKDIRKNGIYATDKVIDDILNNPDFGIELLTKLKEERQARIKAEKTNAILMHVNKTYTATEIAKEIGFKSAKELNKWLEKIGIQYKVNDTWLPKADYSNCGYFEIKQEVLDTGKVIYHRRITQLGREFILNLTEKAI